MIDALFFGRGPLAHADRDCLLPDRWAAYPSPSIVAVVLSQTVDAAGEHAIARMIADVQEAAGGRLRLTLEASSSLDPMPTAGQITSADVPDAVIRATCSPGGSGCTRPLVSADRLLAGARCIQREGTSTRLKAHEFGHAIGLCHIDATRIPDALMAPSPGQRPQDRFSAPEARCHPCRLRVGAAAGCDARGVSADRPRPVTGQAAENAA